jgi:hypothetical protein
MQVTEQQVQRSLRALTTSEAARDLPPSDRAPRATDPPHEPLPDGLLEQLATLPSMRDERLARARHRLETGDQPSAEALAQRMVGRLVCDRLR